MLGARFRSQEDPDDDTAAIRAIGEQHAEVGVHLSPGVSALDSERELVDRAKAGEADAQGALFDQYWPKIVRYTYVHCGNQQDAEDLASDVFLRMVEAIERFQWRDGVPFTAWLFRIARNQVASHYRRRSVTVALVEGGANEPSSSDNPQQLAELHVALDEVYRIALQLPQAQQEVVWLRFAADLSLADTARILSKKENNIKQLQHKAIARIRELLDQSE